MDLFGEMFDLDGDGTLSFWESVSACAFAAALLSEEEDADDPPCLDVLED